MLNPSGGTFHPKLYLARHGDEIAAAVGSANLTSGLVANVELVTVLRGPPRRARARAPRRAFGVLVGTPRCGRLVAGPGAGGPRDPRAGAAVEIEAALAGNPEVLTLGDGRRPNWVARSRRTAFGSRPERSRAAGRPPQLVEAWMIQSAWDYLQAHGVLTNRFLLSTDGLNVKRSSFVCALLARLPGVSVESTRPITLALRAEGPGAGHSTL